MSTLLRGDCRWYMQRFGCQVDAIVTDPPAGIGFMGKEWDDFRRARNASDAARESVFGRMSARGPQYGRARDRFVAEMTHTFGLMLQVLKPGGHAFVWAIPRTSHWTAWALEEAGFEIRDRVSHFFGSGFPKSHTVSHEYERRLCTKRGKEWVYVSDGEPMRRKPPYRDPDANAWAGWGTALKPFCEDWWLCRKPFDGTVAANVLRHGTGALNIDEGRIPTDEALGRFNNAKPAEHNVNDGHPDARFLGRMQKAASVVDNSGGLGRWPPNVAMDEEAAEMLDEQTGDMRTAASYVRGAMPANRIYGAESREDGAIMEGYGDSGGASRFLYVAKASRAERDAGLDGLPRRATGMMQDDSYEWPGTPEHSPHRTPPARNYHPTVKPVALMRWLVKLVTQPGDLVLDPFAGSGTTGMACALEGREFIGIEREPEYADIAERRIANALGPLFADGAA